jgi:hypothetical protein
MFSSYNLSQGMKDLIVTLFRSLFIKRVPDKRYRLPDERVFNILERLAGEGYLINTQHLRDIGSYLLNNSSFVQVICSMKNLEKLELDYDLTLEDLAHVFQSCSKLIELEITAFECKMDEDIKNQLRPGFQRLRRLHLGWNVDNDLLTVMQEMLT